MTKRFFFICLLLILAALPRVWNLGKYSLFVDEKYTLLNAQGICVGGSNQPELQTTGYFTNQDVWKTRSAKDYFEAVARSDFGTHIVYNYLLHAWTIPFGYSDAAMRSLSVLLGLVAIFLVYYLVNNFLKNTYIAYFAAFLVAFDPLMVTLNRIARSYSLSFVLLLLATLIFLKITEKEQIDKRKIGLIALYTLLVTLSILNHYLNFLLPLVHGILFLSMNRNPKEWGLMAVAAATVSGVLLWWIQAGGGQYSLKFLADKNALHYQLSQLPPEKNPMRGTADPSTFQHVFSKATGLFFDLSIIGNHLFEFLKGVKNVFISFSIGLILTFFALQKLQFSKFIHLSFFVGTLLLGSFFFIGPFYKLFFSSTFFLFLLLAVQTFYQRYQQGTQTSKYFLAIVALSVLLPWLYIIFDAFKSGHTTALSQRYIGFSSPFMAIFISFAYLKYRHNPKWIQLIGISLLLYQGIQTYRDIQSIVLDTSPKYTFFSEPRIPNPYMQIAEQVNNLYETGDTLLIPNRNDGLYAGFISEDALKIEDAQYVNMYLSKNKTIIQRINLTEPDLFILKKSDGNQQILFDFEGRKYRY
ncbi:MAG: glycosyltransferase family 39 protein [Spirosomataceae bacterium]